MKKILNSKGFTLVELLAVIVILAVLALVALPNVTNLMNDSRKGSFITEVENFTSQVETQYLNSQISGSTSLVTNGEKVTVANVDTGTTGTFTYFCMNYTQLKADALSKSADSEYSGIIELFTPASSNTYTSSNIFVVYMTNGSYAINGVSLNALASKTYTEGTSGEYQVNSGNALAKTKCLTKAADIKTHVAAVYAIKDSNNDTFFK